MKYFSTETFFLLRKNIYILSGTAHWRARVVRVKKKNLIEKACENRNIFEKKEKELLNAQKTPKGASLNSEFPPESRLSGRP